MLAGHSRLSLHGESRDLYRLSLLHGRRQERAADWKQFNGTTMFLSFYELIFFTYSNQCLSPRTLPRTILSYTRKQRWYFDNWTDMSNRTALLVYSPLAEFIAKNDTHVQLVSRRLLYLRSTLHNGLFLYEYLEGKQRSKRFGHKIQRRGQVERAVRSMPS